MLLDKHARFFVRHQLRFKACRDQGAALSFLSPTDLDVIDVLKKAIAAGKADLVIRAGDTVRLTKVDVREADNIAVLLFRRSDPAATTPIFEHPKTKRLRRSDKQPDEAIAVSAHLFVHLPKIADVAHPSYYAILEEVPSLSRTYIHDLIANILRDEKYLYTDRRGEEKQTYSVPDIHGVKSERVNNALTNSTVHCVTLVRPGQLNGLDTEGLMVPRDQRMRVILNVKPEGTLAALKKLTGWAREHSWEDVLVQFDLPDDRSRTVSIAREADAADVLFVKSELIDVSTPLDACTETINEELVKKAKELFAKDGIG